MNKIKIIDLLNMISKGEEVPKKIKYNDEEFTFTGYDSASQNYHNELEDLLEVLDGSMLNDEVEILYDKDEIKEIIELINTKYKDYYTDDYITGDDVKKLVDYITNLQQRIDKASEYILDHHPDNSILPQGLWAELLYILQGDSDENN